MGKGNSEILTAWSDITQLVIIMASVEIFWLQNKRPSLVLYSDVPHFWWQSALYSIKVCTQPQTLSPSALGSLFPSLFLSSYSFLPAPCSAAQVLSSDTKQPWSHEVTALEGGSASPTPHPQNFSPHSPNRKVMEVWSGCLLPTS